jgi:ATP-dependent Clp protease, protease subunit
MTSYSKRAQMKHKLDESEEEVESESGPIAGFVSAPEMRLLHLYGEVDEKKSNGIVYSMIAYSRMKKFIPKPGVVVTEKSLLTDFDEIIEPIEFLISTPGGSAHDMFAIYDTMRMVKKDMEIHTVGVGKVMSAGTLLLASGTKGKRKIGKHCRVMIHSVVSGVAGSTHDIKNEFKETLNTEKNYVEALSRETKMSAKVIREFLNEKRNIYLSAKEAIKLGIADIII